MNNHIIGTGLTGLVGSRLVELYQDSSTFENIDLATGTDITKSDQVDTVIAKSQASTIIHFAAFTNVNEAANQAGDKSGLCYQVNVVGTQNLAAAAKSYGKHLIHISTDFVFDGESDEPYGEVSQPKPIEWYGQTKLMAEEAVAASGCGYTIVRLAYPYRATHPTRPDMVRNIIDKLKSGTMYPPFADHIITPTFIDDIATGLMLIAEKKPLGEIFHLTGSSWHSDYEIAVMVQQAFDLPGEIKQGSLAEYLKTANRPYQKTMKISNQKIRQLGFTPKTLEEGLTELKRQMENS